MENNKFFNINGYDDNYCININGKIYSKKSKKFLKNQLDKTGYYTVHLCFHNIRKKVYIHKLLAEIFIPNFNEELYTIIDHIDQDKTNNVLSNLRWVSSSINNRNRKLPRRNKEYINLPVGVYQRNNKSGTKYGANIRINKKRKYLGLYITIELASTAYKVECEKLLSVF